MIWWWIVLIILSMVIFIVFLFLPLPWVNRVGKIGIAIGIIFTAFSLWLTSRTRDEERKKYMEGMDNEYWGRIFGMFVSEPKLANMHRQIYGTSIPVTEHSMFSIMMQTVETVTEQAERLGKVKPYWVEAVKRWTSHPMFPAFWKENKDQYAYDTQMFINRVQKWT